MKLFENIFLGISVISITSAIWIFLSPNSMISYFPGLYFAMAFLVLVWLAKQGTFAAPNQPELVLKAKERLESPISKFGQLVLVLSFILGFTNIDSDIVYRLKQHSFALAIFMAVFSFGVSGAFAKNV